MKSNIIKNMFIIQLKKNDIKGKLNSNKNECLSNNIMYEIFSNNDNIYFLKRN